MQKKEREFQRAVEQAGGKVTNVEHRRTVILYEVTAPDGAKAPFTIGLSSGSEGAVSQQVRMARKFLQEHAKPANPVLSHTAKPRIQIEMLPPPPPPPPPPPRPIQPPKENTMPALAPKPAPAPVPTPPPAAPKKDPRRVLSHTELLRLGEWVKATDLSKITSLVAMAAAAQAVLGFPVVSTSLPNILAHYGKSLPLPPKYASRGTRGDQAVIAKHLCALFQELGKPIPDDLRAVANNQPTT